MKKAKQSLILLIALVFATFSYSAAGCYRFSIERHLLPPYEVIEHFYCSDGCKFDITYTPGRPMFYEDNGQCGMPK